MLACAMRDAGLGMLLVIVGLAGLLRPIGAEKPAIVETVVAEVRVPVARVTMSSGTALGQSNVEMRAIPENAAQPDVASGEEIVGASLVSDVAKGQQIRVVDLERYSR
jgi:hypothetical protein